jgi:hypothetical protein
MSDKTSVIRGGHNVVAKTRNLTRTMTTGTQVATLVKGSRILYFIVEGVASNAVTTATIGIGTTAAANQYVTGFDVKTAATGVGPSMPAMVSGVLGVPLTVDTPIYFIYAETGGASTLGNWKVSIVYTTGNVINDTTI